MTKYSLIRKDPGVYLNVLRSDISFRKMLALCKDFKEKRPEAKVEDSLYGILENAAKLEECYGKTLVNAMSSEMSCTSALLLGIFGFVSKDSVLNGTYPLKFDVVADESTLSDLGISAEIQIGVGSSVMITPPVEDGYGRMVVNYSIPMEGANVESFLHLNPRIARDRNSYFVTVAADSEDEMLLLLGCTNITKMSCFLFPDNTWVNKVYGPYAQLAKDYFSRS